MDSPETNVDELLSRPLEQRVREYKYRCAQAIIFGLPVVGLHFFGHTLGGTPDEARRWSTILQTLLAGWVTYVGAAGMLAEGILTVNRRVTADLIVATICVLMYLLSLLLALGIFVRGEPFHGPMLFHVIVILLAASCG